MFDGLVRFFRSQKMPEDKAPVPEVPVTGGGMAQGDIEKPPAIPKGGAIRYGRPLRNRPPPSEPVIYRHISRETGKPDYVGATKNGSRRHDEHIRSGQFDPSRQALEWQPARDGVNAEALYEHEKKKIKQHRPPLNRRNGGAGPRWKPRNPSQETET